MKISIQNLRFETILGILDFERKIPQNIEVECELTYSYENGIFLDYSKAVELIESTMKEEKFYLIEDAIERLFEKIKENFPQIKTVKITISKPDILPNCRVCVSDFRSYL